MLAIGVCFSGVLLWRYMGDGPTNAVNGASEKQAPAGLESGPGSERKESDTSSSRKE